LLSDLLFLLVLINFTNLDHFLTVLKHLFDDSDLQY